MNKPVKNFRINVIGVMSGTSLDGLDICYVSFQLKKNKWSYKIITAKSFLYPASLKQKLSTAHLLSGEELSKLNCDYGTYIGEKIKSFKLKNKANPKIICSHGHTIFHQPEKGFTLQIGSGACISSQSGTDTICDFRSTDVSLGGQGAPLVPIGDKYLFNQFDYCLNLGGFANISFERNKQRVAFDICPVNFVLNHYSKLLGKDYDKDGKFARSGKINPDLLKRLNELHTYKNKGPKSLAREDVEKYYFPIIDSFKIKVEDKLATYCEHVAIQISEIVNGGKVLVTGGGAFNSFLISRIKKCSFTTEFIIPDRQTIEFKEALIFAFLGVLFLLNKPNALSSVTGAKYDSIGGALYKAIK